MICAIEKLEKQFVIQENRDFRWCLSLNVGGNIRRPDPVSKLPVDRTLFADNRRSLPKD